MLTKRPVRMVRTMPAGSPQSGEKLVMRSNAMVKPLLAMAFFVLSTVAGIAAELIMFDDRGCSYCRRWDAEIGPGYSKSAEGRRAPLRRVRLSAGTPDGIKLSRPVTITPTFVVVEGGREVGRVVGYPGADYFYGALDEVLAKLRR